MEVLKMYYNYDDENNSYNNENSHNESYSGSDSSSCHDAGSCCNEPEHYSSEPESKTYEAPVEEPARPNGEYHMKMASDETVHDDAQASNKYFEDPECSEPDNIDNVYSPNYHSTATYSYSVPTQEKPKKEKKKMKSSTKFIIRAACLVLACGIASGACSAFVTSAKLKNANYTIKNEVVLGSASSSDSDKSSSTGSSESSATVTSTTGSEMSADDIYTLACQQAVGIQMSSTATNVFGQTSTSPSVVGSGFIISSDGYIVTNYHVIEDVLLYGSSQGLSLSVLMSDSTNYDAEIVGYDEDNDVAVLKIDATGLNPVTIGDASQLKVGETVYAVGNPLGELTFSMTSGIVSALDRVISTEASTSINVFQLDAAVNSGNSGGPVYNSKGEVIGIVDAKYKATGVEGLAFAIPIDDAMNIITDLIEHGYVTGRAYMGVYVRTVSSTIASYYNLAEGAYVDSLDEDGCAAKAGIKVGDIITRLGDDTITSSDDLKAAKSAYSAGDTASIDVYRNGETITLSITFDEEPANTTTQQQTSDSQQSTQTPSNRGYGYSYGYGQGSQDSTITG